MQVYNQIDFLFIFFEKSFMQHYLRRLCLNHGNTYLMNIFNNEYTILEKIADLMNIEV